MKRSTHHFWAGAALLVGGTVAELGAGFVVGFAAGFLWLFALAEWRRGE